MKIEVVLREVRENGRVEFHSAHAVEREMASTLSDVLVRRTHVAFETRDNGRAAARRIAPLMARLLQWSEYDMTQQVDAYDRDVARLFTIDDL